MADLFDSHAHLISPDRTAYPPSLLRGADAFAEVDTDFTAEWLIQQMDRYGVARACAVQRGHLYGYDNSYVIDASRAHPDRLACVVILDAQDPATPGRLKSMVTWQDVAGLRLAATRIDHYDTAWMITFDRLADAGVDPARFVRGLADLFGADRLMWGSDLGQSAAPYADKVRMAREAAAELSPAEREQFLYATADRLYFGRRGDRP